MVKKSSFLDKLFGGRKSTPTKPEPRKTPNARERNPAERGRDLGDPALRRETATARPRVETPAGLGSRKQTEPGSSSVSGSSVSESPVSGSPASKAPAAAPGSNGPTPKVETSSRVENGSSTMAKRSVEVEPIVEVPRSRGNKKEDAAVALVDGFKDLSGLLHGIQDRMDEQTRRSGDLDAKFHDLPEVARAQIDFMGKISEQVISQEERTKLLVERLSGLPELLDGLHSTLEKQLEREERTERTLTDFRGTMDRIHESIGTLSRENQVAMSTAVESFERSQDKATTAFSDSQRLTHETFSTSQSGHLKQINELVDRTNRANKNMVWLMIMVLGALVILFIAVLNS